jgi:ribosomal protein L7/L12
MSVKVEFESLDQMILVLGEHKLDAEKFRTELDATEDRLYSAQDKVHTLEQEIKLLRSGPLPALPAVPTSATVCFGIRELILAVRNNNKIGQIKAARVLAGLGLKDAKDLVESVDQIPSGPY